MTTKTPGKAEAQVASATGTVRLHRFLKAPPERVYKAFLDPEAMAKWLPPHGFTGRVHKMDPTVGGGYKRGHSLELVEYRRPSGHGMGEGEVKRR